VGVKEFGRYEGRELKLLYSLAEDCIESMADGSVHVKRQLFFFSFFFVPFKKIK